MPLILLGLGSNIGDREHYLARAVIALTTGPHGFLTHPRISTIYENPAWVPADAPADWHRPFLNLVLAGEAQLPPEEALTHVKAVEQQLGRTPRGIWGPREIDIDILALGDVTYRSDHLSIPHADMLRRPFVLVPLAEVAPEWVHPTAQQRADILASASDRTDLHPHPVPLPL